MSKNKYIKNIKGVDIDVYDILQGFEVVNPAIQHAIKKLLMPGTRGYKNKIQDLNEAKQSIERAISLEEELNHYSNKKETIKEEANKIFRMAGFESEE